MPRPDRLMIAMQVAFGAVGVVAGLVTTVIAHRSGLSFAASSTAAGVLELAAGWSLILAGVLWLRSPGRRRFGELLCVGGLTWFIVDWNNPEARWSVLFTVGLVLSTVCPVVIAHAALRGAAPKLHRGE